MARSGQRTGPTELTRALRRSWGALAGVGVISAAVNVLALTSAFFMLQVYDRVIPSGSVPTLVGLGILALTLYLFLGLFEGIRGRILSRIAIYLDESVSPRVFEVAAVLPLRADAKPSQGRQITQDLDQMRAYLSSPGPSALLDMPWVPFYLALCFVFHFWIGAVATAGAVVLTSMMVLTEAMSRKSAQKAGEAAASRNAVLDSGWRNAEVLQAMGFTSALRSRWETHNLEHLRASRKVGDVGGGLGAASKSLRMILQSAVLAAGAWLVIHHQASGGIMIASSIMMGRALAPVELFIGSWRGLNGARKGWRRLQDLLGNWDDNAPAVDLPSPKESLTVEGLALVAPGSNKPILTNISFSLRAGEGLGIIGPSASGKSSLVRAIVGAWTPARGAIRLDGASLDQWSNERRGQSIGYLPQDVELLAGTIGENICRFDAKADNAAIIAAAKQAQVHDMIVHLPKGYDTQIGDAGYVLSAGQRQRIGLARALYRDPFLVVLDEPNSNLDGDGEAALNAALQALLARGGIAIIVAHRRSALKSVKNLLAISNGQMQALGPKEEVLSRILQDPRASHGHPSLQPPAQSTFLREVK